jgi:large subunit ribosomal protein L21
MYAVVKTGGKQYKVAAGEKLKVEQIAANVGAEIVLSEILAVGSGNDIVIGAPLVPGATIKATIVAQGRHDKVRIFKMRRRKHYQKRQGHRQNFTELFIAEISDGKGGSFKAAAAPVIASVASKGGKDDIEIIEGLGPKMAQVLTAKGITTFAQIADAKADDLVAILKASGGRFIYTSVPSWAEQAALLRDELVGGVKK